MRKLLPGLVLWAYTLFSCKTSPTNHETTVTDTLAGSHPAWIMQGNMYEVNTRQYTPEGTFKAFEAHLDRLKDMGVQTLWFMPVTPISKVDRKGTLGSYYAVADYTAINPEYGNLNDFKHLVSTAHDKGFKVITDWVANHTGADHPWLTRHPDFYEKDAAGKPISAFDWTDTRSLDYNNSEMRDSMIASMQFWLKEADIDGFRCDVAGEVPDDFWKACISALKKTKPVLMLAEGDKPSLHEAGFDISYAWDMFHTTKQIAKGERPAFAIDSIRQRVDSAFPADALRLYFTSNHDENSWNQADYHTMPGASHEPFAVLTQTMARSVPLIYSGQEEPVLRKIEFFEKDPMGFSKYARHHFYKTLLQLRMNNAALAADASFKKITVGDSTAVYAFEREKAGNRVMVILNLSPKAQTIQLNGQYVRNAINVFSPQSAVPTGNSWQMEPWGYAVYRFE